MKRSLLYSLTILSLLTGCQESRKSSDVGIPRSSVSGRADRPVKLRVWCSDLQSYTTYSSSLGKGEHYFSLSIPSREACRYEIMRLDRPDRRRELKFSDGRGNRSRLLYIRAERIDFGLLHLAHFDRRAKGDLLISVERDQAILVAAPGSATVHLCRAEQQSEEEIR